jgi:hypothetical protein
MMQGGEQHHHHPQVDLAPEEAYGGRCAAPPATGFQAKADDMPASKIAEEMRPPKTKRVNLKSSVAPLPGHNSQHVEPDYFPVIVIRGEVAVLAVGCAP